MDLGGGRKAQLVVVEPDDEPAEVLGRLALAALSGVVVVIGGTSPADRELPPPIRAAVIDGVAFAAARHRLALVTGGTDAGVLAVVGDGLETHPPTAPVIGIAPEALVHAGGVRPEDESDSAPLERHHTHFVLVRGSEWGDETPMLVGIVRELAARAPVVIVLISGGSVARREFEAFTRLGIPILVLGGSGRLANQVTMSQGRPGEWSAAISSGQVDIVTAEATPDEVAARIWARTGAARGR